MFRTGGGRKCTSLCALGVTAVINVRQPSHSSRQAFWQDFRLYSQRSFDGRATRLLPIRNTVAGSGAGEQQLYPRRVAQRERVSDQNSLRGLIADVHTKTCPWKIQLPRYYIGATLRRMKRSARTLRARNGSRPVV